MFEDLKKQVNKRFQQLAASGKLYRVDVDRDKIWETYLQAFPEENDVRQSNNCNCCKSFLRQYGGTVAIDPVTLETLTLWDFAFEDPEYADAVVALRDYVKSLPIAGLFLNPFPKCGTDQSPDPVKKIVWKHFYFELPDMFVKRDSAAFEGTARESKTMLQRALNELSEEALETVQELIAQNSLYRGDTAVPVLQAFMKVKKDYKKLDQRDAGKLSNFCWIESQRQHAFSVCRIRNTALGTLIEKLSEGADLEASVEAYLRMMDPTNYKRPKALATPKMIENAKQRLTDLGMLGSLKRRLMTAADLTVDNVLHVYRPAASKTEDVFGEMVKDAIVHPRTFSKNAEIPIDKFIADVLPNAQGLRVLAENEHLSHLVSLVAPQEPEVPTMFQWGNNISWSYAGNVADSIKERVKNAGGNVDGVLRVSLSWENSDDLDLHIKEPGGHEIFYSNRRSKSPTGGMLDVDSNGLDGLRPDPVENIIWTTHPTKGGDFQVIVNNFSKRGTDSQGWQLEIEYEGQSFFFSSPNNGQSGHNFYVAKFNYTKKDGFKIVESMDEGNGASKSKDYATKEKWGIQTGKFHRVKAMTLSPNYWANAQGSGIKHYFFMLDKCEPDEPVRGIYNEFLKPELAPDRKVFEMLGNKLPVEKSEDCLAGLGFTAARGSHVFVEVENGPASKQVMKVVF